jgi:hypothetical protein
MADVVESVEAGATGSYETRANVDAMELRVHGVAGTSPESMLELRAAQLSPQPNECGEPAKEDKPIQVGVYGRPNFASHRRPIQAFSWGGLTSGHPATARWLVLLPFVLMNAAGWAAVPDATEPELAAGLQSRSAAVRIHVALVRCAGLLLTGVAAGLVILIVADIGMGQMVFAQWEFQPVHRRILRSVAFILCAGLMWLLWRWTSLRLRPGPELDRWKPASDPAGYGRIDRTQEIMWNHPGIISRLRSLHLGFAFGVVGVIAVVAPVWRSRNVSSLLDVALPLVVAAVSVAVPFLWIAIVSLSKGQTGDDTAVRRGARHLPWALGVASLIVGVWRIFEWSRPQDVTERIASIPALRGVLIALCGFVLLLVLLDLGVQFWLRSRQTEPRTPWRTVFTAPALMLLSVGLLAAAGTAISLILVQAVGGEYCEKDPTTRPCRFFVGDGLDWVAIAFTTVLVVLFLIGLISVIVTGGRKPMIGVRRVMTRPARIFALLFVVGGLLAFALVLVIGALELGLPFLPDAAVDWLDSRRGPIAASVGSTAGGAVALTLVVGGWLVGRWTGVLLAILAIGLVVWAVLAGHQVAVIGVPLPPMTGIQAVTAVGLLLPMAAITTRLFAGMRSVEARRGIGVLWDLGMFWPRWYHPFTPPTYSDRAVNDLAELLENHAGDESRQCLILSGHSQGSMLATSALLLRSQRLGDPPLRNVGLVTYGSPWGRLYGELFASVFSSAALSRLIDVLGEPKSGEARADGDGDVRADTAETGSKAQATPLTIRWRNLERKTDPIGGPIVAKDQEWLSQDPQAFREAVERDTTRGEFTGLASDDECDRLHSGYTLESGYGIVVNDLLSMACSVEEVAVPKESN